MTAQIRADELRNDHLGALHKQLELIDMQSMAELVHSFEEVAKSADVVFGELKTKWYEFGIGSVGAKHALDDFKNHYDQLLSQGKDKDASGLLGGTLKEAQRVLELQKIAKDNSGGLISAPKEGADIGVSMRAQIELKKSGVGYTEKEMQAQQTLVDALKAQLDIEQRTAELKKQDAANASRETAGTVSAQRSAAAKAAAESQTRMGELAVQADRAVAEAQLAVKRASVQARLEADLEFAQRDYEVQLAGNQQQIAALDKLAKDYPNALAALKEKALEISQQHETKVAELTAKAQIEQAARDLADIEQSEREKINATQQGSAARLAAISKAIKDEETFNLQDTAFYRELLSQRVETARQMGEEEAKQRAEAGKIAADNDEKMGSLEVQALKEHYAAVDALNRTSAQQRLTQAIQIANAEYDVKRRALEQQQASIDPGGRDAANKQRQIQNEMLTLQQEHELQSQQLRQQSNQQQIQETQMTLANVASQYAQNAFQIAMGRQSLTRTMSQMANSAASNMIKALMQEILMHKSAQIAAAAHAAASAYSAMSGIPVVGPGLGAIAAGAVFAGAMAFEVGGIVPGVGRGDVVPAMLTPGEAVMPKDLTSMLVTAARSGGGQSSQPIHVHVHPTYHVNTIDGDGMRSVLEKHSDQLTYHFERTLRRMNK